MNDSDQPSRPEPPHPNNTPVYAVVILLMTLIGVVGAVAVILARPDHDNTQLLITLLGFDAAATTSLLGFLRGEQNGQAIKGVHTELNSRLTEWMAQQKESAAHQAEVAYAAGREDQRAEAAAIIAAAVIDRQSPKP